MAVAAPSGSADLVATLTVRLVEDLAAAVAEDLAAVAEDAQVPAD